MRVPPPLGFLRSASPPLSRAVLLRIVLPLLLVSYFGSLVLAAWLFPEPYDWRFRVISNLLSPRDNPHYYRIPSLGIALAGVLMIPLASYLGACLEAYAKRPARIARWSFAAGYLLLVLAAVVVPQHVHPVLGLRRLHELLARSSAMAIGGGMIASIVCAWRERQAVEPTQAALDRRLLPTWLALTLLPVSGIIISQMLLLLSRFSPEWGPSVRAVMRHSVFWHLGFWEWSGSAAVFLFLTVGVLLLPGSDGTLTRPTEEEGDLVSNS